jgi:hypothetical protein
LKGELAAKELDLDQLRTAYAKIAADLRVKKEARGTLDGDVEAETTKICRVCAAEGRLFKSPQQLGSQSWHYALPKNLKTRQQ